MRRLWGSRHAGQLHHTLPKALPLSSSLSLSLLTSTTTTTTIISTSTVVTVALTVNSRSISTAPPLSLLSWSVDAAGHTYRRCKRRLSINERIPLLCRTITEAAPDIVALQDSLPTIAEALCDENSIHSSYASHNGDDTSMTITSGNSKSKPQYDLIGSVRNGRCGYLQLFRRRDSLWGGRLLPCYPSLTAEFTYNDSNDVSNPNHGESTIETSSSTSSTTKTRKMIESQQECKTTAGTRFILTNVDLSYRGKSLAIGGKPLISPDVSNNGSPFTLSVGSSSTLPNTRVKGQLDSHRETALMFVSQVARPDVLLGNFFMGRAETMPGYDDAWVLAGAPAEHERTTNTFFRHKYDAETNHFYFLPENIHYAESTVEILGDTPLGTPLTLNACTPIRNTNNNTNNSNNNNNNNSSGTVNTTSGKKTGEEELKSNYEGRPQVAGRFQRCFFRSLPSKNHKQQLPLFRRYERRQLVVLRPFTEVSLTEEEAKVHNGNNNPVRCSASDGYPILVLLS